ncbi:DUF6596 domain-containing protein [Ideonella sp.]|uniref:DUF6596 domain-containing protein n=1 Tax=Ideonella sp. TaxID=1929293 RepID=UPI003BB7F850
MGCPELGPLIAAQRPRLLAQLVRRLGLARLALAEDAVQQASLQALLRWPQDGCPDQPGAWLMRVALHWAIDQLRAERPLQAWPDDDEVPAPEAEPSWAASRAAVPTTRFSGELDDDELALLFAACHPAVPPATQCLLALRCLTPLDLAGLAEALFSSEAALAQRLARARRALAEVSLSGPLAVPTGAELAPRRDAVLATLLVMFGEGCKASGRQGSREAGEAQARALCWEAIRLARAVAGHPATAHPDADALAAVLLLHGARLSGRLDDAGQIVPLPGQPRDRWDGGMVRLGLAHLQAAQRAPLLSRFHALAGIAAAHAVAPSYAQTDWAAIVQGYAVLVRLDPSPAPRLGHAIALAEAGAPEQALQHLAELAPGLPAALQPHALAAEARAWQRLGSMDLARAALARAVACARHPADAAQLSRLLDPIDGAS